MSLLTGLNKLIRRIEFCSLNAKEIDRLCLAENDRKYESGGTLPPSLRRWLLTLDLSRTEVLEMVSATRETRVWFCDLVTTHEVPRYTYFRCEEWDSISEIFERNGPFRLVVLNDPQIEDYKKAEAVCDSHGIIILNSLRSHDMIVDYARNKGCGAIQFVSDMRDLTGSYEVATVIFRHSHIFR